MHFPLAHRWWITFTSRTQFHKCSCAFPDSLFLPSFSFSLKKSYWNSNEKYIVIGKTLNVMLWKGLIIYKYWDLVNNLGNDFDSWSSEVDSCTRIPPEKFQMALLLIPLIKPLKPSKSFTVGVPWLICQSQTASDINLEGEIFSLLRFLCMVNMYQ